MSLNYVLLSAVCLMFSGCQSETKLQEAIVINDNSAKEIEQDKDENIVLVFDGLSSPDWIRGVWVNLHESNLHKKETLSFQATRVSLGIGDVNSRLEKKLCEECVISELKKDNLYRFSVTKPGYSVSYEFSLQDVDWTDEKVLSYSVTENNVVTRFHSTSIQHLFSKVD